MLLALSVRYGVDGLPAQELVQFWVGTITATATLTFYLFGLGRGMWRFASITDLRVIIFASAVAVVGFLIVVFLVNRLDALPRTAPLIAWFVMIVLLGAPRLAYRALKDGGLTGLRIRDVAKSDTSHVLIIGSASDADRVIRAYGLESSGRYRVHGIVDFRPNRKGRNLRGIPFVGAVDELDEVLARLSRAGISIDAAILAGPAERNADLSSLSEVVAKWQLPLRRVSASPLTGGDPDLENVRIEDLLGRPPVRLDLARIRALVAGKPVAVTGAGGSIGSEIARQVAALAPSRLVMIDNCEYALYEIDQTINLAHPELPRRAVIADVRDRDRIAALMAAESPAIVFHAAALKHVPMVEENVAEGALTNVVGTRNVADAAVENGAEAMVLISTDKTIRPTSVMGASKRAAEAYCQALDVSGATTRFITVRFGNVLGSTGSVVPLFKEQIRRGGPLTVTHPDMRRYFMTIREATELVLQSVAAGMANADLRGAIFVLDMGQPIKIVDLARTLIALAGLRPDEDIEIVFTGLRPGEKLFEEIFSEEEPTVASGADGVLVASARLMELGRVCAVIDEIENAARSGDDTAVRSLLSAISPDFGASGAAHADAAAAKDADATDRQASVSPLPAAMPAAE